MTYEINNSFKHQFFLDKWELDTPLTITTKNHWVVQARIKMQTGFFPILKSSWEAFKNSRTNEIMYQVWEINIQWEKYPKSIKVVWAKIRDWVATPVEEGKDIWYSVEFFNRYKNEETGSWDRTLWATFKRIESKAYKNQDEVKPGRKYFELAFKEAIPSWSSTPWLEMFWDIEDDEVFGADEPTTPVAQATDTQEAPW